MEPFIFIVSLHPCFFPSLSSREAAIRSEKWKKRGHLRMSEEKRIFFFFGGGFIRSFQCVQLMNGIKKICLCYERPWIPRKSCFSTFWLTIFDWGGFPWKSEELLVFSTIFTDVDNRKLLSVLWYNEICVHIQGDW